MVNAAHPSQVVRDPHQIEATLDRASGIQLAASSMVFVWTGVVGLLLGVFRPRLTARTLPSLLALTTAVALYKVVHACPVCPVVTIFGLDASRLGFALYVLATVGTMQRYRPVALAARLLPTLAVPWQVVQFAQGTSVCVPCSIILGLNLACVGSILALPSQFGEDYEIPIRRWLLGTASALGLAGVALSGRTAVARTGGGASGEKAVWKRTSFVGTPLNALIPEGLGAIPSTGCIVELGVATCHPCQDAHRYLSGVVDPSIRFVEVLRPGERASWNARVIDYDNRLRGVPILLTVSGRGMILGQVDGWSDDRRWINTVLDQAREDLSRATSKGKP